MMTIRDELYRMTPERAERLREDLCAQLKLERQKLTTMKGRKARVIKKLDADIHRVEENIHNLTSTIYTIDEVHFNTLNPGEIREEAFDEAF